MGLYQRGLEKVGEKAKPFVQAKASVAKSSSFKTDIDRFYHIVEVSSTGVSLQKVLEILDVSPATLEEWANVLEKQGLIDVVYSPTGVTTYKAKTLASSVEQKTFSFRKLSKKQLGFGLLFLLLLGISFGLYFYKDTLVEKFSFGDEETSSVATDIVQEEVQQEGSLGILLEDAFAGTGVYTCMITLGNFTEEYALNYTDFAVLSSYNGDYSGRIVYLGDLKYSSTDDGFVNSSIAEEDVGPGRTLPEYDSYVCVQNSLNNSLFEVGL
jgi:hypothetical protein